MDAQALIRVLLIGAALSVILLAACRGGSEATGTTAASPSAAVVVELQAGDGRGGAAELMAVSLNTTEYEPFPGSATHIAFAETAAGRVDLYEYTLQYLEGLLCTAAVHGIEVTQRCVGGDTVQDVPVELGAAGRFEGFFDLIVRVLPDVVAVEVVTSGGEVVEAAPLDGIGYALWPEELGSGATVAARDASGAVLDEIDVSPAFAELGDGE